MRNFHRYLSILLLCFMAAPMMSQSDSSRANLMNGREHILALKDGVLLVRLQTKQNSINALEKMGRTSQAEQIRTENLRKNIELSEAMRTMFNFAPVYFFYSADSKHIMAGNLDSVQFLDANLEYDPTIVVRHQNVYTAEVTLISQDVSKTTTNVRDSEESDPDNKNAPKYYGGANMRFQALIIKDDQFNQLRRPFPYYSRTLNTFFIKKKMTEVVETLNNKLVRFYVN